MFQKEISFITDFSLNQVKKLGPYFTIEKLLDLNIHPAIKKYISAEFDFLIYADRQKLIQSSLFDYSGSKISHYFLLVGEEIKKTKKVSYEDIKTLISQAVSFNVSFVLKPNWALQKLVFGDKKTIPLKELELVLNYLYYSDYLKNVFKAYLSKRNIINISATEFELILNKVDRELFTTHFEKLVDNSLDSIADFFSIGGISKKNISIEAVELFLKEKNLIDNLLRLKRAIPEPGKRKYDVNDVRKIIFSTEHIEPDSIVPTHEEDELTGEDAEFEKVKTLKESEDLVPQEEEVEQEEKSDENIIQDLIEEEIVKKDIEQLIEDEEQNNELVESSSEDYLSETEIEKLATDASKVEQKVETPKPEKKSDKRKKKKEVEEIIEPEVEKEIIEVSKKGKLDEEEIFEIFEDDDIGADELIGDEEEDDLLSFYDEEIKELEKEENETEEEINVPDEEVKVNLQKNDITEKIIDEVIEEELDSESESGSEIEFEAREFEIADEREVKVIEEPTEEIVKETEKPQKKKNNIFGFLKKKFSKEVEEKVEFDQDDEQNMSETSAGVNLPDTEEKIEIEKVEFEKNEDEVPSAPKKRKKDLFSFLKEKEIDSITESIFNSDSEDFANTVERISECENYDKAIEIVKALFNSYKIGLHSKDAEVFTSAIANYFDQDSNVY